MIKATDIPASMYYDSIACKIMYYNFGIGIPKALMNVMPSTNIIFFNFCFFLMHNQKLLSLKIFNVIVMIIIYCKSVLVLLIKDFTYISPIFKEKLIDTYVYL